MIINANITGVGRLWRGYTDTRGEVTKAVAKLLANLWRDYTCMYYKCNIIRRTFH